MHHLSHPVEPKSRISDVTSTTFDLCSIALLRRYQYSRTGRPPVPKPAPPDLRSEWIDPMVFRQTAPLHAGGHHHG